MVISKVAKLSKGIIMRFYCTFDYSKVIILSKQSEQFVFVKELNPKNCYSQNLRHQLVYVWIY